MFECSSCGADLRFDIASQKLKCDSCNNEYNVSDSMKLRSARSTDLKEVEDQKVEVYSFVCPQCGGIIYGDRQDLTGFCSYCGSAVELAGRLTTIESPNSVIPFQKTKADCIKIFKKMTRSTPFLPKDYKDTKHIDSFRGIYMPYYLYHVDYDGHFTAKADGNSRRRGDYIYTDKYSVDGNLKGGYQGFEHDASTTFNDEISEAIGPFMNEKRTAFNAGYMCGFYADASDENAKSFTTDARNTANNVLCKKIDNLARKQQHSLSIVDNQYIPNKITNIQSEKTMYPVWFMSYKNGNRVAYAAINGQTGKITADLPIDFKKFLLSSLITAVPLYFLLNLMFLIVPSVMLVIYSICCTISTYMFHRQAKNIIKRDGINSTTDKEKKNKKNDGFTFGDFMLIGGIIVLACFIEIPATADFAILVIPYVAPFFISYLNFRFARKLRKERKMLNQAGVQITGTLSAYISTIAVFAGLAIVFLKPVLDLWYYGGCLILLVCILTELLMIVKNHNYLVTRKPVQFNKKGGDDRV